MDTQVGQWNEVATAVVTEDEPQRGLRQHRAVITALMTAAFADARIHRWLHGDADFRAALEALDPNSPGFVRDENIRNVIQAGCLQMIEAAAGVLKFAREHHIPVG